MKNLSKIIFLCGIIGFIAFSCKKNNTESENIIPLSEVPVNESNLQLSLVKTKWKLIGFGNYTSNTLKKAEPEGDSCYILRFYPDDIVIGWTSTNKVMGSYQLNVSSHELIIPNFTGTEINELFDGNYYVDAIHQVHSYVITNKGLVLYYNNQTLFLLYKPLEQ
ncbi:MAG: hypothetical protein RBR87_13870 [Bacteroidales bacterium]|jgi:hypothetical protein|nr:hypothetical protein [Bacteroidales bacterium]